MNFRKFEKPKFPLNLQQLKVVHHVCEGKDVFGKSQIRNVTIKRYHEHEPALKLGLNHLRYCQTAAVARYQKVSHLL